MLSTRGPTVQGTYIEVTRLLGDACNRQQGKLRNISTYEWGAVQQNALEHREREKDLLTQWYQSTEAPDHPEQLDGFLDENIRRKIHKKLILSRDAVEKISDKLDWSSPSAHSVESSLDIARELQEVTVCVDGLRETVGPARDQLKKAKVVAHGLSEGVAPDPPAPTATHQRQRFRTRIAKLSNQPSIVVKQLLGRHNVKSEDAEQTVQGTPSAAAPGHAPTTQVIASGAQVSPTNDTGGSFGDVKGSFLKKLDHRKSHSPDDVKKLYTLAPTDPEFGSSRKHDGNAQRFYEAIVGSRSKDADDIVEDGVADALASLISIGVDSSWPIWRTFEELCLGDSGKRITDARLPMDEQDLNDYFGEGYHTHCVWDMQYIFRPTVIFKAWTHKSSDTGPFPTHFRELHAKERLPYIRPQEKRGQGGSAIVFKVIVAKDHLESRNSINKRTMTFTRKEFKLGANPSKSGRLETLIYEHYIRGSLIRHGNVMKPVAGYRQDTRISILFPLAYCDLEEYMRDKRNNAPAEPGGRLRLFQRCGHLASALDYLHNGIQTPDSGRVTCYHLDLKPENILAFLDSNQDPVFKIADFGLTKIVASYQRDRPTTVTVMPDGDARRVEDAIDGSDQLASHRDQGVSNRLNKTIPYISPEGRGTGFVTSSSDVWSFGCILCTFLAWLLGGWDRVLKFNEERKRESSDGEGYYFQYKAVTPETRNPGGYTNKISSASGDIEVAYSLNPAVRKLLQYLQGHLTYRSQRQDTTVNKETSKLLMEKLF